MIAFLNDLLWGSVLIYVLIPIGIWFTVGSRVVQFRYFGAMWASLRGAFHHESDKATSFQALALSVAGRVGSGNITGVAVAIALGGPGAIFWMWIVGLLGMATSFMECSLAQLYKRLEPSGNFRGGPALYIRHGLGRRLGAFAPVLGGLFAVLLMVTFPFAFNILQSYALSTSVEAAFGIDRLYVGLGLAALLGAIVFGGLGRILDTAEFIVPIMAVAYIALALVVIGMNVTAVPDALSTIVSSAFGLDAAIGGGIGAAILQGVRRGLFSNEAGLGSAPNVAALAYVRHPAQQGVVQALSVFIDTILICTSTALIILLSDIDFANGAVSGVALTQNALATHVGEWAESFVAIALGFFVFTSIMYNYVLGENAIDFFIGEKPRVFRVFQAFTLVLILIGSTLARDTAFAFADVTMGVLALVNLFALILLFPIGRRVLADFDAQRRKGIVPVFDPDDYADLDIDRSAWVMEGADADLLATKRASMG
ncbi:MAG: alanine/glycine:cation symporter family protein [Alphaproteobacteria bacterium]